MTDRLDIKVICPYCKKSAELSQGLWRCKPCCALGEVDPKTKKLMGTMANQEAWSLRNKCYKVYADIITRNMLNGSSKTKAKQIISEQMNPLLGLEEYGMFRINKLDAVQAGAALQALIDLNDKTVPICPYCSNPSEYHKSKKIYRCDPCDAQVGVHKDTTMPLGTMANKELRAARKKAHSYFDPLWRYKATSQNISKMKARKAAYDWLAKQMGLKVDDCHIGEFDLEQCQIVIQHCKPYIANVMSKSKQTN